MVSLSLLYAVGTDLCCLYYYNWEFKYLYLSTNRHTKMEVSGILDLQSVAHVKIELRIPIFLRVNCLLGRMDPGSEFDTEDTHHHK